MAQTFCIEFETDKGDRFFATCKDLAACVARAHEQWPNDGLTIRTMEVIPQ